MLRNVLSPKQYASFVVGPVDPAQILDQVRANQAKTIYRSAGYSAERDQ